MLVLRLVEFVVIALVLIGVALEIFLPLVQGRPMFPHFTKQRDLESDVADANQELVNVSMEEELKQRQDEINARRVALKPVPPTQGESTNAKPE